MERINWQQVEWTEAFSSEILKKHFNFKNVKLTKSFKECDIIATKTETVEIKVDYSAKKTGNLFIEFHNSKQNEPSGIFATSASYYLIFAEDYGYFLFRTEYLKYCVQTMIAKNSNAIKRNAGDNNSDGVLIPIQRIFEKYIKNDFCKFVKASQDEKNQFNNGLIASKNQTMRNRQIPMI